MSKKEKDEAQMIFLHHDGNCINPDLIYYQCVAALECVQKMGKDAVIVPEWAESVYFETLCKANEIEHFGFRITLDDIPLNIKVGVTPESKEELKNE